MPNTAKPEIAQWYSIAETAGLLGCHPNTVRNYIAAGQLKAYRVGPRFVRIKAEDLAQVGRGIPTVGGAA